MALDVNELPDQVLTDILSNLGVEDETEKDLEVVGQMTAGEAMDRFLTWNGIMGFTGTIIEGIDGIRAADSIQEIRELVNPAVGSDFNTNSIFDDVAGVIDHHGHMGHEMLKLVATVLRLGINDTAKALALLKIREVIG